MKLFKPTLILMLIACLSFTSNAQTVDEILDTYYEAIGGRDAWNALEGMKLSLKVNQGGMEIPIEQVQTKSGKSYAKITFQGLDIMQGVYDGESLWSTNFQTMKPEKVTSEELANHKLDLNDFPDPFLNYKANNYTAELVGTESFDGTDAYKIKLVKEPLTIDGEKVEDISFYYFEVDSGAMIGEESEINEGPMKGKIQQIKMSDYQEVGELYMPFSMTQGVKDGPSQPITIDKIELNPTLDETMLEFPKEAVTDEK